jgi:hypothetical protein
LGSRSLPGRKECGRRERVHLLAQIARIPTLGDGQEANDCVPSTFWVTLGCGRPSVAHADCRDDDLAIVANDHAARRPALVGAKRNDPKRRVASWRPDRTGRPRRSRVARHTLVAAITFEPQGALRSLRPRWPLAPLEDHAGLRNTQQARAKSTLQYLPR